MAGTADAVPAVHRTTAEIFAARRQARGQPHDTHVLDRPLCKKQNTFLTKADEARALCQPPVTRPEGLHVVADYASG
jgi:hypothetical protein